MNKSLSLAIAFDMLEQDQLLRSHAQDARYRWWHMVLLGTAANLVSGISVGRGAQDRAYYENQRQAWFAPPGWVFAPAWAVNNISTLWGNLRLLNLPPDTPHRRALIRLQGASWFLFSTFAYVYFTKRSPILAFAWTAAMYALTIWSVVLAARIDRKIVWSLLTLFLWLSLATVVAGYQMIHNPDPLFGTKAWR
jgi:translocator protein